MSQLTFYLICGQAYEQAASIANEALSNVRTVAALNAEPMVGKKGRAALLETGSQFLASLFYQMSKRYDAKLGESEKAAIRQGLRTAFLTGSLFLVIFCMYGFGFWFGARLIAQSVNKAIETYPAPSDLLDESSPYYSVIELACADYFDNPEALDVCACGLPWASFAEDFGLDPDAVPNCGCGFAETSQGVTSILTGCVSGGRVMMVFFSILIGGFSLSQIGPGVKALADARIAAAKIQSVINRKPGIGDKEKSKPLSKEKVNGELRFENMHFTYETSKFTAHEDDDEFDVEKVTKLVFGGCNMTIKAGETVALGRWKPFDIR